MVQERPADCLPHKLMYTPPNGTHGDQGYSRVGSVSAEKQSCDTRGLSFLARACDLECAVSVESESAAGDLLEKEMVRKKEGGFPELFQA